MISPTRCKNWSTRACRLTRRFARRTSWYTLSTTTLTCSIVTKAAGRTACETSTRRSRTGPRDRVPGAQVRIGGASLVSAVRPQDRLSCVVMFRVDDDLIRRLKAEAALRNQSVSALLRDLVAKYV